MRVGRDASLLKLQQGLMAASGESAADAAPAELLAMQVAQQRWTVPCEQVARVVMPVDVISLAGYPHLPAWVVGAVASDSEVLSVVDAGLLLAGRPVARSLKARLVVFGDGPLKGIALLVDRVHERTSRQAAGEAQHADAASLHAMLQEKSAHGSARQ